VAINYAKTLNRRATPQSQPIPGSSQVRNSGGGYSWQVDDWTRLDRFLILGALLHRGTRSGEAEPRRHRALHPGRRYSRCKPHRRNQRRRPRAEERSSFGLLKRSRASDQGTALDGYVNVHFIGLDLVLAAWLPA
jgi:hypothetical protein